jgi:hypothetical protein
MSVQGQGKKANFLLQSDHRRWKFNVKFDPL